MHDYYLGFREYLHAFLLPLACWMGVASLLTVAVFPALFYLGLIKPLGALLQGVRQMNAGQREVVVPVQYADEIGFLARAFNQLAAELSDLITNLENRVAERTAELEAQNAELDAFAHTVAHDLKKPLAIVTGGAQLLVRHTDLPGEAQREMLQSIERSARKGADIVDNLLLLASARHQAVTPQPLDMGRIVSEALSRLGHAIDEQAAEIIAPELTAWPQALGYAPWVEEVWVNYISNALTYGGRPPHVEIGFSILDCQLPTPALVTAGASVSDLLSEQEQSKIHAERPKSEIKFWVHDNGPGLTPEEQVRLFVPFTRLHQARGAGHGLGLSIVLRIVNTLGGQAGVKSQPGQGCLFYFTLPAAPGE